MVGARPRFLFRIILFLTAATAWCQSFDDPAHALAQKIAAALKPHEPVALSFHNVSSASASDAAAAQAAIEREMGILGVDYGAQAPGTELAVTLSESLRDLVWVAEIRRGGQREVVIEERPKPAASAASVAIEKRLMFEQNQRILDLAPSGHRLVVLDAEGVSVYESAGVAWQRKLSIPIPMTHPWPRDLRGRILAQGDVYQAYLPGVSCNGTAANGLSITCRAESLWPIGAGPNMLRFAQFAPARNFFDGRIVASNGSERSVPAFFSAAEFKVRETTAWALAGVDGRAYVYSPVKNGPLSEAWGSNIAGVESVCGARSQLFVTARGDDTASDSVRAYDVVDGTPRLAGEVAFSGPVTELWPAGEPGVAFAISRDLKSGRYAAFRLAITCAH
jgi:hypothetical protein